MLPLQGIETDVISSQSGVHAALRRDPVWPLPAKNGRAPSVVDRASSPGRGLELAYPRAHRGELVATFPPDGPNGSTSHFATPTARHRSRAARVRTGDVLGYIGASRPGAMKCLRFELWRRDREFFDAVDPTAHMRTWVVLPWTDERITLAAAATVAA